MKIQSLKLVYFSPTGTTKAIIQGIARGIPHNTVELIDITKPDARKQPLQTAENELLLVGVPVYMGRMPALVTKWLHGIKAGRYSLDLFSIGRLTLPGFSRSTSISRRLRVTRSSGQGDGLRRARSGAPAPVWSSPGRSACMPIRRRRIRSR